MRLAQSQPGSEPRSLDPEVWPPTVPPPTEMAPEQRVPKSFTRPDRPQGQGGTFRTGGVAGCSTVRGCWLPTGTQM